MRITRHVFVTLVLLLSFVKAYAYTLSGTVYGGPTTLADTQVTLKDNFTGNVLETVTTDAGGQYSFEVDAGTYDLEIQPSLDSGYEHSKINGIAVADDVVQDALLILVSIHQISAVLTLPDGTPVPNATLKIARSNDIYTHLLSTTTDLNGNINLNLAAGTYTLYAWVDSANIPDTIGNFWVDYTFVENLTVSDDHTLELTLPYSYITGTTVDSNGSPIGGVKIGISGNSDLGGHASFYGQAEESLSHTVSSADDGSFSFWVASHSNYSVLLTPPSGHETDVITSLTNIDLSDNTEMDFALAVGHYLTGSLSLPDGTAVPGATLKIALSEDIYTHIQMVVTASDGSFAFNLPSGEYVLYAWINSSQIPDAIGNFWVDYTFVESITIADDQTLDLTIPYSQITGTTTDSNGNPLGGVKVGISGNTDIGEHASFYGQAEESPNNSITSGDDGEFSFWVPSFSNYAVLLTPPEGHATDAMTSLTNIDLSTNRGVNFALAVGHQLSGKIQLPDGTPISGATLKIASSDNLYTHLQSTNSVNDGSFSFHLPAGEYTLYAWIYSNNIPDAIGNFWVDYSFAENIMVSDVQHLDLTLPYSYITGKTTDSNGAPITNVRIGISGNHDLGGHASFYGQAEESISNMIVSDNFGAYTFWVPAYSSYIQLVAPVAASGFAVQTIEGINLSSNRSQNIIIPFIDETVPQIISGPHISNITDKTAQISWQTNELATSEILLDGSPASVTGHRTVHSIPLTDLSPETEYEIHVSTTDLAGNGPTLSETITFTTLSTADTDAPTIILGPTVSAINHNSAIISWETNEPSTTQIAYGTDSLDSETSVDGLRTQHQISLESLDAETAYQLQISATDAAGNGPTTSPVVNFTTTIAPDTDAPVITAGPIISDITDTSVTISWTTNEPAVTGVSINDGEAHLVYEDNALVTEHVATVTGLTSGTQYEYRASSTDAAGNGPTLSEPATFYTHYAEDTTPPAPVEAIKMLWIGRHSALVHWHMDEPVNSVIEYGLANDNLDKSVPVLDLRRSHTALLVALTADTEYFFRARMTDKAGNEYITDVQSFTTRAALDIWKPTFTQAPLVAAQSDTSAVLNWQTDEPVDVVAECVDNNTATHRYSSTGKSTHHSVVITGLQPGESCDVNITATDSAGNSATFNTLAFSTDDEADETAPVFTQAPQVIFNAEDYAIIRWVTDEPTISQVKYGPNFTGLPLVASADLQYRTEHIAVLTGLKAVTGVANDTFVNIKAIDVAGNSTVAQESFRAGSEADATAPSLSVEPAAEDAGENAIIISWETDEYASSELVCTSQEDDSVLQVSLEGLRQAHSAYLNGLELNTVYTCTVRSSDAKGNQLESASFNVTASGEATDPEPEPEPKPTPQPPAFGSTSPLVLMLLLILSSVNSRRRYSA